MIQLYSALLYNAHLRGFIQGEIYQGKAKAVCVPGFNCYSCPGAVGACPLGSLQNALAYSGHRAGWYVLGILMIFGLTLGRTICGWLCPLGFLQELLHKIPTPKIKKSRVTRALSYLKYVILGVFVVAIPMWYGIRHGLAVPGFCKYICPAGTSEGAIGLLANPKNAGYFSMLKILFTRKFVILLIICLACIFCYRSFCRFICPLGAIYGLFNKLALVSVKVDENRCNACGACVRNCQMDVRHVGDHECINCARCMSSCSRNALSLKAGTYTILAPACGCADDRPDSAQKRTKHGRIAWGAALAVLCFALVWFNFLDPSVRKAGVKATAPQTVNGQTADAQASAAAQTAADQQTSAGQQTAADQQTPVDGQPAADQQTPAGQQTPSDQHPAEAVAETETEAVVPDAETTADSTEVSETETAAHAAAKAAAVPESEEAAESAPEGEASYASTAPVGIAVGEQLGDFTTELIDGASFHLAEQRGKVVILNMWATYCAPCVQELPIFQDFLQAHEGDAAVLIVHASDILEDVPEFLEKKEISLPCAIDSEDNTIYNLCGASPSVLPHTVILNRKGEIVYNQTGSMTKELLDELFEKAK